MKEKTIKKIIIACVVLFILLIILLKVIQIYNEKNKTYQAIGDFKTVKEVAEFMHAKHIKTTKSSNDIFKNDIYVEFKYKLDNKSVNLEFEYDTFIRLISIVENFKNFRLIDKSQDLIIEVLCSEDQKVILQKIFNGDKKYFENKQSNNTVKDFEKIKNIEYKLNSKVLENIIDKKWDSQKINLGNSDGEFNEYDIYFNQGYEIRNIQYKIYNLVFTLKYKEAVIDDIKVGTSLKAIIQKLGNPQYGDINTGVIGYTTKEFHVFFANDRISIYRNEVNTDTNLISNLIDKFNKDLDAKSFVSGVTDIWKDYSYYDYSGKNVTLKYALKGIKFVFSGAENGIYIYSNYNGQISKDIMFDDIINDDKVVPKNIYFNLNSNLMIENEYEKDIFNSEVKKIMNIKDEKNKSKLFYLWSKVNTDNTYNIQILSKTNDFPNSEFENSKKINDYEWFNDQYLVYTMENKGIYIYDAKNKKSITLIEGNEKFKLLGIEGDYVLYDENKTVRIK